MNSGSPFLKLSFSILLLSLIANHFHLAISLEDSDKNYWLELGKKSIDDALKSSQSQINGQAKNVIMFIGDGMGIATVTASRIFKGQLAGKNGEEGYLNFEKLPNVGLLKTYNTDRQIPDSAATATALFSGVKAKYYTLGYSGQISTNSCSADIHNYRLESVFDWAIKEKKRTGLVTTTRITHATPAASYAHSPHRDWECPSKIPEQERNKHCIDIATQLVQNEPGLSLNVIMGGGLQVLNGSMNETTRACFRGDDKNLVRYWEDEQAKRQTRFRFIRTKAELEDINPKEVDHLMGLFAAGHINYDKDRTEDEPSLEEMTRKALQILKHNEDQGFLLIVEGGRIDHAHHDNYAKIALEETVAFDKAIQTALDMVNIQETLVLVTADHSHSFAISGYASRGSPIEGMGDHATAEGFLYHTLGYINGPAYNHHRLNDSKPDSSTSNTWRSYNDTLEQARDRYERHFAGFWAVDETHGGEDVPIYAKGPMAHLFNGVYEQTHVAHTVAYAACIGPYSGKNCQFTTRSKSSYIKSYPYLILFISICIGLIY